MSLAQDASVTPAQLYWFAVGGGILAGVICAILPMLVAVLVRIPSWALTSVLACGMSGAIAGHYGGAIVGFLVCGPVAALLTVIVLLLAAVGQGTTKRAREFDT